MKYRAMSRRTMLGACVAAAGTGIPQMAGARADAGRRLKNEEAVRKYYAAWETKDWHQIDTLLAGDFTFSSPLDDHISRSTYKAKCWDTQIAYIAKFDLEQVTGTDKDAFVLYLCHTTNGKTFRNVEYFEFADGKVKSVECHFGGQSSFPSAVSSAKG